jgi:uncharacterized protein (DUF433 family)
MSAEIATEHPQIVRKPGTCGGSPIIRGTRMAVWLVAAMWKSGDTIEEIVKGYPHLRQSWVHDAISYYLDHQQEIDQEIESNRIENVMKEFDLEMDERGILRPRRNDDSHAQ